MEAPEPAQPSTSKGNMMKYIMLGGGGFVLMLIIAFGIAFMLKPKKQAETETPAQQVASTEDHPGIKPPIPARDSAASETLDTLSMLEDDSSQTAMDKIMDNLAFLDYTPDSSEMKTEQSGMSVEDSLKEVNWIKQKKDSLATWENSLNDRQKKLDRQQQEVEKKMLVLEQAESSRVTELAKLYDGMDSRAVARLMTSLDDATVIAILPKMKTKNASEVLQLLPAQRAASLSKRLITIAEN